jgi:hypothetical protein
VHGDRLREAQAINLSLSTLGDVIGALSRNAKDGAGHVPFRDSKLTYLLKGSLSGQSKVLPRPLSFDRELSHGPSLGSSLNSET